MTSPPRLGALSFAVLRFAVLLRLGVYYCMAFSLESFALTQAGSSAKDIVIRGSQRSIRHSDSQADSDVESDPIHRCLIDIKSGAFRESA